MQFAEVVEEFVSLEFGPEMTSCGAHFKPQNPLDQIISNGLPSSTPVVCLTYSEDNEDTVAGILRVGARERGVAYHYIELDDMWDRDSVQSNLGVWSCEGGWMVIGCSYLQRNPQKTWQQLTEVGTLGRCGSFLITTQCHAYALTHRW